MIRAHVSSKVGDEWNHGTTIKDLFFPFTDLVHHQSSIGSNVLLLNHNKNTYEEEDLTGEPKVKEEEFDGEVQP